VTGLHCGTLNCRYDEYAVNVVFPVFVTGLHCGLADVSPRAIAKALSSRSS
jgi:hypothetical protein